jgi:glutathione synthase/RimK-type ligase-like ATP-grasp enzyme
VRRVAVATSAGDDFDEEIDPDAQLLRDALRDVDIDGQLCVWDDASVKWSDYEIVVIRSTWDYTKDRRGYLEWARSLPKLFNPYPIIEYSTDKHYLDDLASRGHRIIPTSFCDVGERPEFPDSNFVVKPTVGAGSMDAEMYDVGERVAAAAHVTRLHDSGRDAMIQPYVASVDEVGERGLVFIDGSFSHAIRKNAMLHVDQLDRHSLFRLEQLTLADAEPDAVTFAESVMSEPLFDGLLYGRVDLVKMPEGWAIMELELVEPSLFLSYNAEAASRLATAIFDRLG